MNSQMDLMGLAASKPKRITVLTSGTGTYIPLEDNARTLWRLQGGGGSGGGMSNASYPGGGGGGGAMVEAVLRVPIGGVAWVVGAGGPSATGWANGVNGSSSVVGTLLAEGGKGGAAGYNGASPLGTGGLGGALSSGYVATADIYLGVLPGISGGGGGDRTFKGYAPGFTNRGTAGNGKSAGGASMGGGGGGDSFYGAGGNGGSGAAGSGNAGTGYGAGGGGNGLVGQSSGAGTGGCIEIWEY